MRGQRTRLARAATQLLEHRLANTTDPLKRARLKETLGIPLSAWGDAELFALRAVLPTRADNDKKPALPNLESLDIDELLALKGQLERKRG